MAAGDARDAEYVRDAEHTKNAEHVAADACEEPEDIRGPARLWFKQLVCHRRSL
jgi:hypothetical protein